MTSTRAKGILAIWNDCTDEGRAEYEAWYRGEHLRERVGLPGFRFGRRYMSLDGSSPRYFTYYETDSVGVLSSPVYLERGANPTPMTRHIMTNVFRNMSRTVCSRVCTAGEINGPFALTIRANSDRAAALEAAWNQLSALDDRLRAELWTSAENPDEAPSNEERIRGKDKKIDACVVVNFSDAAHAEAALSALSTILPDRAGLDIGLYRLTSALDHVDIAK